MRLTRYSLTCILTACISICYSQVWPEFDQAIDPASLQKEHLLMQLDTSNDHRKVISLHFIKEEFGSDNPVSIQTFYQKSNAHDLLQMGRIPDTPSQLFGTTEGLGHTYFFISDGNCEMIVDFEKSKKSVKKSSTIKKCIT